ncbi:zinc finger, CCHC-type containing protein [Tanacetum coccineum]
MTPRRETRSNHEKNRTKKNQRARNEKSFGPDFVSFMVENEPTSYRERNLPRKATMEEAIKSEIESILQNHTTPADIEGYSDANWISDIKDSRSTSGYVFTLGGAAISWKSSKQTVIAKSTMESEFIALDKCGEEAECYSFP